MTLNPNDSKIVSLRYVKRNKEIYKRNLGDIPIHTNYLIGEYDNGDVTIAAVDTFFQRSNKTLFFHLDHLDNYTDYCCIKIFRSDCEEKVGVLEEKKKKLNFLETNVEKLKKEIIELEKRI